MPLGLSTSKETLQRGKIRVGVLLVGLWEYILSGIKTYIFTSHYNN